MIPAKLFATVLLIASLAGPVAARVRDVAPYQGGQAAAQDNYQRYGDTGYAEGGDVNKTCVKLCRRDTNPCDPPVFKQADGRCANPFD